MIKSDPRYLQGIRRVGACEGYPFTIPSVREIDTLQFSTKVTYITGENGSGKSTIMEAIAKCVGINPEGRSKNVRFSLLGTESDLFHYIQVVKTGRRINDAFFMRAETAFNLLVAAHIDHLEHGKDSWINYGYGNLKDRSHGEFHLDLLMEKMKCGLYLFDEPESGLSVDRQYVFLVELERLIQAGSQVIIATHSPIILAYPDSTIYHLGNEGVKKVAYEDSLPYTAMKSFIDNRKSILHHLLHDVDGHQ